MCCVVCFCVLCVCVCCVLCAAAAAVVVVVAVGLRLLLWSWMWLCVCVLFLLALKKRSRVYFQNISVCTFKTPVSYVTRAFRNYTREHGERFQNTHGSVSSSLSLSPVHLSCHVCLCFFCLSLVSCSMTMTVSTRPVGSPSTHGSDLLGGPRCTYFGSFPVGRACSHHAKKQLSKYSFTSLVLFGMKWACFCAGDGEVFKMEV